MFTAKLQVEESNHRWREAIGRNEGELSQVEGSNHKWRGVVTSILDLTPLIISQYILLYD